MTTREAALREKLAALCHEQWSGWMKYLWAKSDIYGVSGRLIPRPLVQRWERQMTTPYADLPEAEKDSDCKEADRILALIAASPAEQARERVIEAAQEARHNDDCVFWRPHKTGTTPWPCNCALGKALAALDAAGKGAKP